MTYRKLITDSLGRLVPEVRGQLFVMPSANRKPRKPRRGARCKVLVMPVETLTRKGRVT